MMVLRQQKRFKREWKKSGECRGLSAFFTGRMLCSKVQGTVNSNQLLLSETAEIFYKRPSIKSSNVIP